MERLTRPASVRNLFDKKFDTFDLPAEFSKALGSPEKCGFWLVWGREKNGKTWMALLLTRMFSELKERVLYISAEEGFSADFVMTVQRAKIDINHRRILFLPKITIEELETRLAKKQAPRIIIIDNATVYNSDFRKSIQEFFYKYEKRFLIIFLAHEEDKKPFTTTGRMVSKLARILIHVEGLRAHISGRCPGGILDIDTNKAALYHGQK